MVGWHLAQLNVARLMHPLADPRIKDFVDGLEAINRLAEDSTGFVWRLQTDAGNATGARHPWSSDPFVIVNMSVWLSAEDLRRYVYNSGHVDYLRRRLEWFERPAEAHYVLWWIPAGHLPSLGEAQERLELYRAQGASEQGFSFGKIFPAPE